MPGSPRVPEEQASSLRRSMLRFVLLSLAALAGVTAAVTWAGTRFADEEAVHDAAEQGARMSRLLASPLVTAETRRGMHPTEGRLETELRNRVRDASVSHILLWDPSGRVIWADDPTLIGRVYPLPSEIKGLFGNRHVLTERSGDGEEERRDGLPGRLAGEELIEVYVGAQGADGLPFVFEAYLPPDRVGFERSSLLWQVLPISLGGLILFQLLILPLAYSLARRVDRGHQQRLDLIARSLSSWHAERRRLAQDLHDGVVQDLAGATYTVPLVRAALPAGPAGDEARQRADGVGATLIASLDALRTLAVDLFPADLGGVGLLAALRELTRRASDGGLVTHLDVEEDLELSAGTAGVVYRVVREALRNAENHASARQVWVRVVREGTMVLSEVVDDGVGLPPRSTPGEAVRGRPHLGLSLLRELLRDVDGTLAVSVWHSGGTVLQARVPQDLPG